MKKTLPLLALFLAVSFQTVTANNSFNEAIETSKDSTQLGELNSFWAEVSRTVRTGDFEGYSATCHEEGVLVSGKSNSSVTLAAALEAWKPGFVNTKEGKSRDNVEFRFSQRIVGETSAHETGIFHFTSTDGTGTIRDSYIHFEALLVKQEGVWKILMEYQKNEGTKAEWDNLG